MQKYFSANLVFLRKKFGKTQTDVGLQVNKSQRIVSNWERGETEPSLEEIGVISEYFGISVGALVFENLSDDNLINFSVAQKKRQNDNLNDNGNDNLNVKNYDIGEAQIRQVAERAAVYAVANKSGKVEQLYEAQIAALNNTISDKNTIIAQLSADNERLKRDILVYESAIAQQPKLKTPKQVLEGSSHGHK